MRAAIEIMMAARNSTAAPVLPDSVAVPAD
jgi:hypothetical protein